MGRFLLGFTVGLAVAALVWSLLDPRATGGARSEVPAIATTAARTVATPPPLLEGRASVARGSGHAARLFPAGTAVLRIGDAYRFGDASVTGPGEIASADLSCLDLRETATLACPHGAAHVMLPVITTREVPSPAVIWSHTEDAPERLSLNPIELAPTSTRDRSGVILVRSREGTVFRVYVSHVQAADLALDRTVEIRFAPVAVDPGGGVARIPGTTPGTRVSSEREAAYVRALTSPAGFNTRVDPMRVHGRGLVSVPSIHTETPIEGNHSLVHEGDLVSNLQVDGGHLALVVDGDVAAGARIEAERGTVALLVEGDLRGDVTVGQGSMIRIRGDLLGTLRVKGGIANVVLDGDLVGRLEMHGICFALIRGRVTDPKNALELHGIQTIYLGGFVGRDDVPLLSHSQGIHTLHLERSDLETDARGRVGGSHNLIVGDPVWEKLGD